ncbi:MAG: DUF4328 domain-containing protein [Planctomycetes bacterium]|jgi:hypothetical protein|nr:DUF4328 domain-containing protein [Planctomycetota bacterium]
MAEPTTAANRSRARLATIALALCGLMHIAELVLNLQPMIAADSDALEPWRTLWVALPTLFAAITFLFWLHRAQHQARRLGLPGTTSPTWAVLVWFVPVVNLIQPMVVLGDLWNHAGRERVGSYHWIGIWWVAFLVGGIASARATRFAAVGNPLLPFQLLGDALLAVAAGLTIVIVRRLAKAHEAMAVA